MSQRSESILHAANTLMLIPENFYAGQLGVKMVRETVESTGMHSGLLFDLAKSGNTNMVDFLDALPMQVRIPVTVGLLGLVGLAEYLTLRTMFRGFTRR